MRRLLIFVLAALTLLAAGCGTAQPETSPPDAAPPEAQAAQPPATPVPTSTATPIPDPTATPTFSPTPLPGRAMVRAAEGGTVELATDGGTGIVLEIPPGALREDTEIAVQKLDESEIPADLAGAPLAGAVFRLEPDGQEFSAPVTMALTLGEDDLAEARAGSGISRSSPSALRPAPSRAAARWAGD